MDKELILKHIDKIFEGFIKKDFDLLKKTHKPRWTGFLASSREIIKNREEYLKFLKEKLEKIDYERYKILEINFHFNGDSCVVPYIAILSGKIKGGKNVEFKLRIVDFFVKENGEWNLAGSCVNLHPDELDKKFQKNIRLILNE